MENFIRLIELTKRLRRECPWDREQTHESLGKHLIEESYEVLEAIEEGDPSLLKDELGDLLLQVLFHANIAEERGTFTFMDVSDSLAGKLITRHPHVFGDTEAPTSEHVKQNWEKLKRKEGRSSVLDGLPAQLPALLHASRIQEKAASVGFDWEDRGDVWKKVLEESEELRTAVAGGREDAIRDEFGDVLFALVNYARFIGVDPEASLRATINRFKSRFSYVESELRSNGKSPEEATAAEMNQLWEKSKMKEG